MTQINNNLMQLKVNVDTQVVQVLSVEIATALIQEPIATYSHKVCLLTRILSQMVNKVRNHI